MSVGPRILNHGDKCAAADLSVGKSGKKRGLLWQHVICWLQAQQATRGNSLY